MASDASGNGCHRCERDSVSATAPLAVWLDRDGSLMRLRLARPKANLIDAAMIAALYGALRDARGRQGLRCALLDAEGPHFSFGASVDEHRAENCAAMLSSLHALIVAMLEFPVPILAAVRGQCLGGGLEVALATTMIFATPDAALGQPEMKLGVFAPAASCLLPYRVGQATAEDLLLSGRTLTGAEAKAIGLVDALADDPAQAALAYFDAHLAQKSAAALAFAIQAVRAPVTASVAGRLAEVERLYVNALMKTRDANEGIAAFLEKRQPSWEHR
jgi:cyclohexa-1,5-dienecarbonyl-CoA hydratase